VAAPASPARIAERRDIRGDKVEAKTATSGNGNRRGLSPSGSQVRKGGEGNGFPRPFFVGLRPFFAAGASRVRRMQKISMTIAAALLLASTPAAAAELTLERVFQSPSLSGPTPRLPKLSPDGRLATLLRNRADDKDRYDLWAVDTSTGEARMLVDSLKVGTGAEISEEEKMRRERARIAGTKGITAYEWAPDGKAILVPIDGDLYLATLDGSVRRLTDSRATEVDAKVSETGRFLSFVRDSNLFVTDVASGAERQLTTDGGGTLSWGTAEFVSQEEMGRSTGHWWSPGRPLAGGGAGR
jgi:dipeptidyl-peptidase-4